MVQAIAISVPIMYYLFKERISFWDFLFGVNKRADLKYWALTLVATVMLAFVVVYTQANSILRYSIIILPMYWVSAIAWSKNSKVGKFLLLFWISILIAETIIFASGKSYIL